MVLVMASQRNSKVACRSMSASTSPEVRPRHCEPLEEVVTVRVDVPTSPPRGADPYTAPDQTLNRFWPDAAVPAHLREM